MSKVKFSTSHVIASAALAATVAILLIVTFSKWFDGHEGAAAWVQAIGIIATVAATGWIASLNFSEERRRQGEAEHKLYEAIGTMSERCMVTLYAVVKATEFAQNRDTALLDAYRPSDLDAPLDGLAAVPLYQLGDVRMVQAVITMRRVMGRVRTELNEQYHVLTNSAVSRGLNIQALAGYKTEAFNAHASIMRITYGYAAEDGLRRFS